MKGITMAKSMGKKGTICGPNSMQAEKVPVWFKTVTKDVVSKI
jgi:hypothetical protein